MIRDALLSLMKRYSYKSITITQICQEARVVRQTYYRNFTSKDAIVKFHLDNLFANYFRDYFREENVHANLNSFFEYMLSNREFLKLTSENNLFFMIDKTITENITGFINIRQITNIDKPNSERYVTGFIASTICSLLSLWVDNDFLESTDTMAAFGRKFLIGLNTNK